MKAGDIVRHADYPQWANGYVIRSRKTTEVFFHWGGRRTITAGEPLESSTATKADSDLFALCARLAPQSWSHGHYSVYAIELDPTVSSKRAFKNRNPGGSAGGCLYVGMTGLSPEKRFARHRAGTQSGKYAGTHSVRLRLDLVEGFSRLPYSIAAFMEPKLAAWLRAHGFGVWQN